MNIKTKKPATRLEISLDGLLHNLKFYKSLLPQNTQIVAMVKAFSYGNGGYELSKFLEQQGVEYIGVANVNEGVNLRKNGVKCHIIVMNPKLNECENVIKYSLEPEIYNFTIFNDFINTAKQTKIDTFSIHLKVETGMHRLGFIPADIKKLIQEINKNKIIKIASIFSHLSGADQDQFNDFTLQQISAFEILAKQIVEGINYKPKFHILNSAGIERFSNFSYDMVRLGIGLYGFSVNAQHKLKNVSSLKTQILQIKTVSAQDTVGYSRNGRLIKEGKIAILPIGYGDGISRAIGNGKYSVLINGQEAPLVGNVCMDMCMVNITNIAAKEGDEVIVFGQNKTANEMAKAIGTISYEIITSITQRVPRVFIP